MTADPTAPRFRFRPARAHLPAFVIVAAMLFQAVTCFDELSLATADVPTEVNDHIFHYQLAEHAAKTDGFRNDPWIPEWGQGFPVLRYYQNLPHLAVGALDALLPGTTLFWTFKFLNWLLLVLLPLSFAVSIRWLGFDQWTAALASILGMTLSVAPDFPYGLGLQTTTFTWLGGGLFPQLFASVTAPLALGAIARALRDRRGEGRALLFLWLTWMSHLVLGYATCLLGACVLVRSDLSGGRHRAALTLVLLYLATALSASALLLPALLESPLLSRSIWENPIYWDSHGTSPILEALVGGKLLDGGGFPAITLALGLGLAFGLVAAFRRTPLAGLPRDATRFLLAGFTLALLLFFGRHALGGILATILPFSSNLPFHRFICIVQLFGVFLGALGLTALTRTLVHHLSRVPLLPPMLATLTVVAILAPGLIHHVEHSAQRREMRTSLIARTRQEWPDVEQAMTRIEAIRRARGGRAYAGASWNWGRNYTAGGIAMHLRWATHDIPAISYMFHTMGRMSDVETAFDDSRRDHWDLFDMRAMMVDSQNRLPPFATIEGRFGRHTVASVDSEGPLGLVRTRYFVDTQEMAPKARYDFAKAFVDSNWHAFDEFPRVGWQQGDKPRHGETAWKNPSSFPPLHDIRPVDGTIEVLSEKDDAIEARIRLREPATLLLRKTFHPAWEARVNGTEADTVMLAPSFLGVRLEAGEHVVALTYRGSLWLALLWWLGPLLVASALARDLISRRGAAERTQR